MKHCEWGGGGSKVGKKKQLAVECQRLVPEEFIALKGREKIFFKSVSVVQLVFLLFVE